MSPGELLPQLDDELRKLAAAKRSSGRAWLAAALKEE